MQELYDTITNWNNTLGTSYNSRFITACATCETYKNKGYSRNEASEMLISQGLGMNGSEEVLDSVYGKDNAIKTSSIDLFIVPTRYSDVKNYIEYQLKKVGPEKFVSYLTDAEAPIIKASSKFKKTLVKIAQSAYENPNLMEHMHEELEPYIEEAMLNSVLIAENEQANIQKVASNQYKVEFMNREASVDLEGGHSTGTRYTKGNFKYFGLADEFLVKAHDTVSPYTRLRKVVIRK